MPKNNFSRKVLERFLTAEEINELEKKYTDSTYLLKLGWTPNEEDWKIYDEVKSVMEAKKRWDCVQSTVYARLGKMRVIENDGKRG